MPPYQDAAGHTGGEKNEAQWKPRPQDAIKHGKAMFCERSDHHHIEAEHMATKIPAVCIGVVKPHLVK